jgi:hypothetical protein
VRRFVGVLSCLLTVLVVLLVPAVASAHEEAHGAAAAAGPPLADHVDTPQELSEVSVAQEVNQARLETADGTPLQAASALPSTWCGTERTTDDTANAATTPTLPHFKVLYLHPSDRPDRFAQWKDLLQANTSLIGQFVSAQAGSSRAPRFDLGTSCGPEYVDVQTVHLPGTRATYLDNFAAIKAAVRTAVGTPAGLRNYVVLADTLNGSSSGSYGLGDYYAGSASAERPDASNPHNNGNLFAALFYRDVAVPSATANGWWPTGMLHEMTHAMGAVQWSAPHTTQPAGGTSGVYGHCWDGLDIMCYADGPAMGHAYDTTVCSAVSGAMNQTYDCNQDDYFNATPAAGSYLATHWNVYNNVFLADCGTLPAGTCLTAAAPTGPPVSTVAPAITGTARRGQTLSVGPGSWNPAATGYAYQWQRDTGGGYGNIAGAAGATYVLGAADVGASIRVQITATNALGDGAVSANPVGPIADAVPVNTAVPAISGATRGGPTLTATVGTWSPAGTAYAFQWQRDAGSGYTDIGGATAATYTTVPGDVGATIRVRVSATNAFGSVTATSTDFGPVGVAVPTNTSAPAITGTARRGQPLAVNGGAWNPAGTSYAFQWQRDAGSGFADIAGATATSYTPVTADIGAPLRVTVTATNAFGAATATTTATAAVAADPPVNVTVPVIGGTTKRTFTLTASAGSWTPTGNTYTYRWQRDTGSGFADISGATAGSYPLVTADVGARVRVTVTATNPDGSASASSSASAVIGAAVPGLVVSPAVTGAMKVGEPLLASTGSWFPAATSYAYQWQRRTSTTWADISGATAPTYTLVTADVGASIRVAVTATNADGSTVAASGAGATVSAPPAVSGTIPVPSGTLVDASVLAAVPGSWTPSSATFTYQWLRCGSGATSAATGCVPVGMGPNYTLTGEDVGHAMGVRVTAYSGTAAAAAVSTLTPDVAGRALTNVRAPAITGSVTVADPVKVAPGLWNIPTLTVRYQWLRCDLDGTNCADIPGGASMSYAIVAADAGHALAVRESVTSPGRSGSVTTDATVVADQPLPVATSAPSITGVPARTNNLQMRPGTWANQPSRLTYAWQRCDVGGTNCTPIARATASNYVLVAADVGHTVTVAVTAVNTAGTGTAEAPATDTVAPMLPELRSAPAITGTMQVPGVVQAVRTAWKATSDTRYAFRWQRCNGAGASCVDISGATAQSYRLKTADARATLRAVHTASNADGAVSSTSAPTVVIKPALPGISTYPRLSVSGRPDVGRIVTLTPGAWSPSTEIDTKDPQFWRCSPRCTVIPSGGAATYTVDPLDVGAMLRGSETATGPGGTLTVWAPTWLGPVRSSASGYRTLAVGVSSTVRTSGGVALASASVAKVAGAAAASTSAAGPSSARSVRVTLRRAASASGRLRAWACVSPPDVRDRQPCTSAISLQKRAVLKLGVAKGQRVLVLVVRRKN